MPSANANDLASLLKYNSAYKRCIEKKSFSCFKGVLKCQICLKIVYYAYDSSCLSIREEVVVLQETLFLPSAVFS